MAKGDAGKGRAAKQHGCLVSAFLLPWMMLKLVFVTLPKAFVKLPLALTRSVSSQSTSAAGGLVLAMGVGRLQPPQPGTDRDAAVADIRAHDPGFAPDELAGRAAAAHAAIGASMVAGDADSARLVMADGLWRTFRMLVAARADSGVRREASVDVTNAEIVEAFQSTLIDEVRVRLECTGTCVDVHSGTGLVLRGTRTTASWHEDLTFTRSARAVTPPGGGVLAHTCPNCGAALRLDDDGACTTCRALVTSGQQDWVVTSMSRDPW